MEIIYKLDADEIQFLVELFGKESNKGQWTGMMSDDKFNDKWRSISRDFVEAGLAENKNTSNYGYWRIGLNQKGMKVAQQYAKYHDILIPNQNK